MHNTWRAICDLREASQIEPHNPEIVNELAQLELGACHDEKGKRESTYVEEEGRRSEKRPCLMEEAASVRIIKVPDGSPSITSQRSEMTEPRMVAVLEQL